MPRADNRGENYCPFLLRLFAFPWLLGSDVRVGELDLFSKPTISPDLEQL